MKIKGLLHSYDLFRWFHTNERLTIFLTCWWSLNETLLLLLKGGNSSSSVNTSSSPSTALPIFLTGIFDGVLDFPGNPGDWRALASGVGVRLYMGRVMSPEIIMVLLLLYWSMACLRGCWMKKCYRHKKYHCFFFALLFHWYHRHFDSNSIT